jgi:hypothetical protein
MDRQTKRKSSPLWFLSRHGFLSHVEVLAKKNHVSDINFPRKEGEKWAGRRSMRPSLEAIVLTCRFDPPLDYSSSLAGRRGKTLPERKGVSLWKKKKRGFGIIEFLPRLSSTVYQFCVLAFVSGMASIFVCADGKRTQTQGGKKERKVEGIQLF